jgi:regulator of cell morphogenesis and NO signaling
VFRVDSCEFVDRTISGKVPADVCVSYKTLYEALEDFERDLHQHLHLENNILFPRAIELEEMSTS